jgi:hypothetical protein
MTRMSQTQKNMKGWRILRIKGRHVRVCKLQSANDHHPWTQIVHVVRHWNAVALAVDIENNFTPVP